MGNKGEGEGGSTSSVKAVVLQIAVVSLEGFLKFSLKSLSCCKEVKCIMFPFEIHLNTCNVPGTDFAV